MQRFEAQVAAPAQTRRVLRRLHLRLEGGWCPSMPAEPPDSVLRPVDPRRVGRVTPRIREPGNSGLQCRAGVIGLIPQPRHRGLTLRARGNPGDSGLPERPARRPVPGPVRRAGDCGSGDGDGPRRCGMTGGHRAARYGQGGDNREKDSHAGMTRQTVPWWSHGTHFPVRPPLLRVV